MRVPGWSASAISPFIAVTILVPLCLFLFSGEARADETKLVPSLSLKEEYNDNVFFTQSGKKDDFITTTSPSLELSERTEKLDLDLFSRFNWLKYAKNDDLSGVEQDYRGRLGYSFDPKLKFSVQGEYKNDIRPGRDIEITGLVLTPIRRRWQNYTGSGEYNFSEKTKANLSYTYEQSHFADPQFVDYEAHDVNLGFTHDLSQYFLNTAGRMNLGYDRYQFQSTKVDYYNGTIGMTTALNEKWSLLIDAGGSYVRSEFDVETPEFISPSLFTIVKEQKKQDGWGWVGMATLSYKGEKTTGDLVFSHRTSPASASVGVAERTSLTINITHRFTYELSGRLSAGYYINKADKGKFSIAGIDQDTFRINPAIRYEFSRYLALEASYSFAWVKNRLADIQAERNLFMINVIIQYPIFK